MRMKLQKVTFFQAVTIPGGTDTSTYIETGRHKVSLELVDGVVIGTHVKEMVDEFGKKSRLTTTRIYGPANLRDAVAEPVLDTVEEQKKPKSQGSSEPGFKA